LVSLYTSTLVICAYSEGGAVIVWQLDLQLLMPIITDVVSSNHDQGEVYNIVHVIKFVSDLQQVGGFLRTLQFPPPIKLTTTI